MDYETAANLLTQVAYLGDFIVILSYALGVISIVLGTMLIPAAARPMNSTSWFGRQINPQVVMAAYITGVLLIALPLSLNIGGGVLLDGGFDSDPLSWTTASPSMSEAQVMSALITQLFRVIGLIIFVMAVYSIRTIPLPNHNGPTPWQIITRMLAGLALMILPRIAEGAASVIPILAPFARIFTMGSDGAFM